MKITEVAIEKIIPYVNNPRNNDKTVDFVASSIKEYGFKVPLVLDSENVIVTGHTRYEASKKLELKTLPCIIAKDLTPAQIKAFRIADNKVAEFSTWNEELLKLELEDIETLFTGFSEQEKQLLEGFTDIELEDLFEDINESHEKKVKKITCPHCSQEFEL